MTREEFLTEFQEILQTEETLSFELELASLEEWDSLSKMATVEFLSSSFNVNLTFDDFAHINTIEDVALKAGI